MSRRQAARNGNKNRRTVPSTFRIEEDLLDELREEARRRGVSPSTLLNNVVKSHVNWHFRAAQAGFVSVRKSLVIRLFAKLSEDEIAESAKQVALELRESIMLMEKELTIHSAMRLFNTWLEVSGYTYRLSELDDGSTVYIIQHDMGGRWSQFMAKTFLFVAKELGVKLQVTSSTENIVSFELS